MSSNERPEDDVLTGKTAETSTADGPDRKIGPAGEGIDDNLPDFDVNPSGTVPDRGPHRPPKSTSPLTIIVGIAAIAAIIGLTWYAFRSEPLPEPEAVPPVEDKALIDEPVLPLTLPEKVADAADFSPTPEAIAAAEARPSVLPTTTSAAKPAETKPAEAKPAEAKPAAKPAEAKPAEAKPAEGKPAEAKPAEAKPAEAKPAEAKPAEAKPAEAKPAEAKPAEAKPAEAKPAEAKPAEAKPAATAAEAKPVEAQPAATPAEEAKPAEAKPAEEVKAAESPVLAISTYWVVNISSTPDAAESLRLLSRMMAADAGGQVYAYETTVDGRPHHRIRVGFFETRAEAETVGLKLKEEYKLTSTPWAVKPTVEEVERYRKK